MKDLFPSWTDVEISFIINFFGLVFGCCFFLFLGGGTGSGVGAASAVGSVYLVRLDCPTAETLDLQGRWRSLTGGRAHNGGVGRGRRVKTLILLMTYSLTI